MHIKFQVTVQVHVEATQFCLLLNQDRLYHECIESNDNVRIVAPYCNRV